MLDYNYKFNDVISDFINMFDEFKNNNNHITLDNVYKMIDIKYKTLSNLGKLKSRPIINKIFKRFAFKQNNSRNKNSINTDNAIINIEYVKIIS